MYRLNNIKQNVLILSFATLLAGCGGGGTTTATDAATTDLTTTSTPKRVQIDISAMATEDSATINWTPYGYTTKSVEYGTTNKYGSEVSVQEEGTVTLYNLQANTEYHYRIVSEDEKGRPVVSNDNTFTTLAESTQPIVTEPVPTDPIVTEPIVTEPAPTDPIVTDPIVTEPAPTETNTTEPTVTEPAPTEPVVTDPIVTEPAPTDPIVTEPAPVCQSGPAMQQGQIKDSTTGIGLSDVTVTISGCSTQTDIDGYYTLNNIVENDNAIVTMNKEGYLLGSTTIEIKELSGENTTSQNYLEYTMYAHDYNWNYNSTEEILSSRISIANSVSYVDLDGNPYSGTITAELTILDPEEESFLTSFPGGFNGINTNGEIIQFESYGLFSISLKDINNNTLRLSENEIATLVFNSIPSSEKPYTIPLWYFDDTQNTWIEDGYAELQEDGTYKGEISHLGIWSLNKPLENDPGIYRDRILYPDGTPVKNLRVHAIGANWIITDLSTDENGVFEIEVIPGQEFTLKAYHYTDKYGALYNGVISAVAPGDIVDNSSL